MFISVIFMLQTSKRTMVDPDVQSFAWNSKIVANFKSHRIIKLFEYLSFAFVMLGIHLLLFSFDVIKVCVPLFIVVVCMIVSSNFLNI